MRTMLRDTQRVYAIGKINAFWKPLLLLMVLALSACTSASSQGRWLVCDGMPLGQNARVLENSLIFGSDASGLQFYMSVSRFNVCKLIPDEQLHPAIRARWELDVEAAQ